MARKRSKALGTAQSMTPAMPIADVLDASAFGIEDIVTTPSSIPKPTLQMPFASGAAPTLQLPSFGDVSAKVHDDNVLANQMADGREAAAKSRWAVNQAEGDVVSGLRKTYAQIDSDNEVRVAEDEVSLANQMADGREAAAKERIEKTRLANQMADGREAATAERIQKEEKKAKREQHHQNASSLNGTAGFRNAQRQFEAQDNHDRRIEEGDALMEEHRVRLEAKRRGINPDLAVRVHERKKKETADAASAQAVADYQARHPEEVRRERNRQIAEQFGGNGFVKDRTSAHVQEIKDRWKANREAHAKQHHLDHRNKQKAAAAANRERYSGTGGYNTEHDEEFADRMQKGRKAWAEKHDGDTSGFDKMAHENPANILGKKGAGLVGDFKDFLGRQQHAHRNIVRARSAAKHEIARIDKAMGAGTLEAALHPGDGGGGFLSENEVQSVMKTTSGRHGLLARGRDSVNGFLNKHLHTSLKTDHAERIRNKSAMGMLQQKRNAQSDVIESLNAMDERVKNFDVKAIQNSRNKPLLMNEAGKQVEKQKAAAKASKGLGWKSKAGAVAALLGVGAVLGNMMGNHGEQSNAQLYNPNPQPQYAN